MSESLQPKHNDVNGFTTHMGWGSDAMITVHNVFPSQGRYTVSGYYVNTRDLENLESIGDTEGGWLWEWQKIGIPEEI